jgi:hypothetical protein
VYKTELAQGLLITVDILIIDVGNKGLVDGERHPDVVSVVEAVY